MSDSKNNIKTYFQPAFLICAVVLATACAGMSFVIERLGVYMENDPFPLKKSLEFLDENGLAPYKVIHKRVIKNKEVIESLGTTDYIEWTLEDTDPDSDIPKCFLFITYYDLPDRIPHVPEECYSGGGYQKLLSDSLEFLLPIDPAAVADSNQDDQLRKIPARHIAFSGSSRGQWGSSSNFSVLYLFNINGDYANSRENARVALNKNVFGKYTYFCKVEWYFIGDSGKRIFLKNAQATELSQKLMSVILPKLEKDHWPDLKTQ